MGEHSVVNDITDALFELLKTKRLPDITITELIKKAGVCRSSYYRNFYLTEDVVRQYGIALYADINRRIPIDHGGIREHILAVNTYLWHHRERLALIEKRGLFYLLEDTIMDQYRYQIRRLGLQSGRYRAEFFTGAMNQLVRAWIRNDFAESPREITDIICELLTQKFVEI